MSFFYLRACLLLTFSLLLGIAETAHGQHSTDRLELQWNVGDNQDEENIVFGDIRELAYHPANGLHVLDVDLRSVHRYGADGRRVGAFDFRRGEGPGEMHRPMDFAVHGEGDVFIVDRGLHRVVQFTPEGDLVQQHSVSFQPTRVASRGDRLFLTSFWPSSDSTLYVSDVDGSNRRGLLPRPPSWMRIAETGNFERLAVTPQGTLLYSMPFPYRLVEVDADGTIQHEASGHPEFEGPDEEEGVARLQQGARGVALMETGQVVHLIFDRVEERVYLDLFSRDLTFEERIDITDAFPDMPLPMIEAGSGSTLYFVYRDPYYELAAFTLRH